MFKYYSKKKKFFIIFSLVVLLFILFNIFRGSSKVDFKTSDFEFAKISKKDIKSSVSATGFINPVNVVTVGSQLSGMIDKIYADYNDNVKEGDLLAEVDKSLLIEDINSTNAKMMQAKARFDLAKLNKEREEKLFEAGYTAKLEFDQAITDLASAEADYISAVSDNERSKRNMGYAEIKSPVSGVIISRDVEEGQTIASSFSAPTLFTIAEDLTQMQIEASISEADIGNIKKGQVVNFTVDAFPLEKFKGFVDEVRLNPVTEQNVVIYNVIIKIDNKEKKLLPGMTAFVEIDTLNKEKVLSLENYVLQFKPDTVLSTYVQYVDGKKLEVGQNFIYIFDEQTKTIKALKVNVGITNGIFTEILSEEFEDGKSVISDFVYEGDLEANGDFDASKLLNRKGMMGGGGKGGGGGRGGPSL